MSEQEANRPQQQANDGIVDLRNEAIAQTANLYLFGRQVVLASVGLAFLGVDAVQAFVRARRGSRRDRRSRCAEDGGRPAAAGA